MNLLQQIAAKFAAAAGLPVAPWRRPSLSAEPRAVSSTVTAASIQSALRSAEAGDTRNLFALYRDMALDNHVQAELQKRKLAVICEPWQIIPNDKASPADVAAAQACDVLIERCSNWSDGLAAQLDATIWPLATCEKIYRPGADGLRYELDKFVPVNPTTYCWLKPASGNPHSAILTPQSFEPDLWFYQVNENGTVSSEAKPADPDRHWVYRGHLMHGVRDNWGGPMRGLLFWWLLRLKGREWFAHLIETWGKPYPAAFVDPQDSAGIAMLEAAFSPDKRIHGLVVSNSTRLELQEIALSGSADAHEKFGNLCNREISLLIVGQTLSSQAQPTGLGSGTADLQSEVRADIRAWDQQKLGESIRQQVFAPFLRINGLPGRPPRIVWGGVSQAKVAATAAVLVQVTQAGLEPTDAALPGLSESIGFELQRKAPAPAPAGGFGGFGGFSADSVLRPPSSVLLPAAARGIPKPPDAGEKLVRTHSADLARAYRGALAPFRQAILESTSREDCLERLKALYADWPGERLAAELDRALQIAAAEGAAHGVSRPR
jgi:phage gp29-like protein